MKKLALFDFDGTITSKDTLLEIARFSTSVTVYKLKILLLLPLLVVFKMKWIKAQRAKEIFLKVFFGKKKLTDFDQLCTNFCKNRLPHIIRPKALQKIKGYMSTHTDIYIVSASPENWIRPWADQFGIKTIATVLDTKDQRITGRIAGINCNGQEKTQRIRTEINLSEYDQIIAYGDTKGDVPMLDLADIKHFKPFT